MNVPWDSGLLEQRMEIKRTQPFFSGDMLVFQGIPGLNEKAEISKKEKTVGIFFAPDFFGHTQNVSEFRHFFFVAMIV